MFPPLPRSFAFKGRQHSWEGACLNLAPSLPVLHQMVAALSPGWPGQEPALCPSTVSLVFPTLSRTAMQGFAHPTSFLAPREPLPSTPILCVSLIARQLEP